MSEPAANIKTEYIPKPIPFRCFDWEAFGDDNEDMDSIVGMGATREEAIADFKSRLASK